jgi:hypothetical protein
MLRVRELGNHDCVSLPRPDGQRTKNGDTYCVCVGSRQGSQRRPCVGIQRKRAANGASPPPRLSFLSVVRCGRGGAGRGRGRDSLTCKGDYAHRNRNSTAEKAGGSGVWRSDSRFLSAAADDTSSLVLVTRGCLGKPNTNRRSSLQKDSRPPSPRAHGILSPRPGQKLRLVFPTVIDYYYHCSTSCLLCRTSSLAQTYQS